MSTELHPVMNRVTQRILERSKTVRERYLVQMQAQAGRGKQRGSLSCGNLAHAVAACGSTQKQRILNMTSANLAIISAYNDMLSAHHPYAGYPEQIKLALATHGHSAQFAGGVPAMCDGVTQGQPGMDMSLFSRDLIAQATALSLSHNTFDATLLLGICDKIAPGQLIGALAFGHLPTAFLPAGPMATGISNDEKVKVRQQYAAGEVGKEALQEMECNAYHSPGTCTFYGTANTNQLVFEAMGLMLPGSAFVHPHSPLRQSLTEHAALCLAGQIHGSGNYRSLAEVVDEKALVNGLIALLASGGSSNHTLHMVAVARAAGLIVSWNDFSELSEVVPLLARVYPNGPADINAFQQAGGVPLLMHKLAERGLLHMDATPMFGKMEDYFCNPELEQERLTWQPATETRDPSVIPPQDTVFSVSGGLRVLDGNLGRGVIKVSAVASEHHTITAPAAVFSSQHEVERAYQQGELNRDVIVVVHHNGPSANGMPELHKLMPILGNIQKAGFKVALITDGRLSGASGKIPAAIHITPEAAKGGPLSQLRDGDLITLDATTGRLSADALLEQRTPLHPDLTAEQSGLGRELFAMFRRQVSSAETGASIFNQE